MIPAAEPAAARIEVAVPHGASIADIVALTMPRLPEAVAARTRVTLVTDRGTEVVDRAAWARVRPKPGVRVVIRTVPGGNALRSVLMIVVSIAAVALGQLWALPLANALGGISTALTGTLITLGVTAIGMLLINALVPIRKPTTDEKEYGGYSIQGWRNTSNPDGPIPAPMGRLRFAPYYAAPPYTEIVGDIQYMRAVFVWGYGPAVLSDLKIGETSIDEYDEVEIEHRLGWPGDEQLTLYTRQVIEEGLSVDLTRAWQRNDDGSYKDGGTTIEKSEVRYTAGDVTEAAVIIGFPGGLYAMDDDGSRQNVAVKIRIRQRPIAGGDWSEVTTLSIVAAKSVPFWRQFQWTLPARGAWQVELTRMTDENRSTRVVDRATWQALQSIRPEYPLAFDHPLVLTAVRIKATYQLNGQLDNLSGVFSRVAPDWDAPSGSWITRETRSPAAAFRWMLQGPAATYPEQDSAVDLDLLADWSAWCEEKGLRYDRVHDQEESFADALSAAASAGRAQPRHDGRKWGVVVDRPATLVVDHINPRNSRGFQWTRTYPRRPDGFRVKFSDATNEWKTSERVIPWPGLVGDVTVTEQLEIPGKCDPDEIWIEARRRQYETDLRPDTFRVTQDGMTRVATRGDLVAVSHDVLSRTQTAGRVTRVEGDLVVLDEPVEMVAGVDYAIRFRVFGDPDDVIGSSIVRRVATVEGSSMALRMIGSETSEPTVGDLVHVGPRATESLLAFIRSEERGDAGATVFHLVAAAPEIDAFIDAETPPAWSGRAGSTYTGAGTTLKPARPTITGISSGTAGTGDEDGLVVHLDPGAGSAAIVSRYTISHRPVGASAWATTTVNVAAGGASLTGYAWGDAVEIFAVAISLYGVSSDPTETVNVTIGAADPVVPDPTSLAVLRVSATVRRYTVEMPASSAVTIVGYRLRARPGAGWSWADLTPMHSGYLTGSPWESARPLVDGTYTIGAVCIDGAGTPSRNPLLLTTTLGDGSASGLSARIESALGWPGTIAGGAAVGGELVGTGATLSYTLIIDLGADMSIVVAADGYGVEGSLALAMRTGTDADGAPVGSPTPLGDTAARWVEITATVTAASGPRLGDLVSLISGA